MAGVTSPTGGIFLSVVPLVVLTAALSLHQLAYVTLGNG